MRIALLLLAGVVAGAVHTAAQTGGSPADFARPEAGLPASLAPAVLRDVAFDQHLRARVPLDLLFRDENGAIVRLGAYFRNKPVILALVYYDCPMLCTQVLNGLTGALRALALEPGADFTVLSVSFNPAETPPLAAAKKQSYMARYARPGAAGGWHFLTGDTNSIRRLTDAVGFRYVFDQSINQYAHPTGITVLTPEGRISHYLFGIEYGPRDLRLALVDASARRIGTPVDRLLLYCYHYDPAAGKYSLATLRLVRAGGVATVGVLGAFILMMARRDRAGTDRL